MVEVDFEPPAEFDDYLILSKLGSGQMGHVYLAEDAVLARQVAIKFIAGVDPDLRARQRFLMEARTAARIQHPNVVGVYRVGELGDRPYIVSELIRGKSLTEHPRPMPPSRAIAIAIELARGLAAAHRRGVVHCDVNLNNAMITNDGVAKLVDFGLARVVGEQSDRPTAIVGTPDTMAPEVWEGNAPSRRSDVYSFGAMLFMLLAGAPPFSDVDVRDLPRIVRERQAPSLRDRISDIDPRIAQLVARCLDRDPELRFASGEELREALEQLDPARPQAVHINENPYRGLRTFEAAHRGLFFGRGSEIGAIIERLRTEPVVIATGDSGVGKSSLLRAGVIPAIVDGALGGGKTWDSIAMVPGRRPLLALAIALGDPELVPRLLADPGELPRELRKRAGARSLVLFVDQLEELVTVGDPAEVAALEAGLARLSESAADIRLVATVRADFLSRIAALPQLGRELSRLLYFVSPLPPERIRDVITGPASATGIQFESEAMIATLVDATAQAGSGGLPLLSFALAELWEARDRDRGIIPEAALTTMGGVAGALARHGDAVLASMPASDRLQARRLLLRLVTSVGTRVRRTEGELAIGDGTRAALDALVRGRLLVVHDGDDGATYELAHEVLVRGWGTLRDWLAEDAENQARRERVAAAAAEWYRAGRRVDATLRGEQLAEALTLDTRVLTARERDFIDASSRAGRRRIWLRRAAVVAALCAIIAAVAIQRRLAAAKTAHDVDVELTAARDSLAEARSIEASQAQLANVTFAKFDTSEPTAEVSWKEVAALRARGESAYRVAAERLESALAKDPARQDVRDLIGDVLYERAALADERMETERRDELLSRLRAYDVDGTREALWSAPHPVTIRSPVGAATWVQSGEKRIPLQAGTSTIELATGSYIAIAHLETQQPVRVPFIVRRDQGPLAIDIPAPPRNIPPGLIFIPAGAFIFGSYANEDYRKGWLVTAPAHTRHTGAYLIAQHEITIGEWLEYVEAQPVAQRTAMLPTMSNSASCGFSGGTEISGAPGAWRFSFRPLSTLYTASWGQPLEYVGRKLRARQDWRRFPMGSLSPSDLQGYFSWLDKTGRVPKARLCGELEWERAARGADARIYPHGRLDDLDEINVDNTYGQMAMGPDEVGSHPRSASPFGLHDMSGNVFEWTRAANGKDGVLRGGSSFHDPTVADVTGRVVNPSEVFRDSTTGSRVCADIP